MIDQKAKYAHKGLVIEFVGNEHVSKKRILQGEVQLLFISPENTIANQTYRTMFLSPQYKKKYVGLIIDEAHCVRHGGMISEVFAQIGELRSLIPAEVNIMALTATTTSSPSFLVGCLWLTLFLLYCLQTRTI